MKIISKKYKLLAWVQLLIFLYGLISPSISFGLSNGPSAPESSKFTASGMQQLVDPFSGDFSYQIPIMDIEGYPISLSYNSNVNQQTEASWVGLGWTLNPGAINRQMRGIPDDFDGENIVKQTQTRPTRTFGMSYSLDKSSVTEIFGYDLKTLKKYTPKSQGGKGYEIPSINTSTGIGIEYNNYKGIGLNLSSSASIKFGGFSLGESLSHSSFNGFTFSPSINFALINSENNLISFSGGLGGGITMNSRSGLQSVSFILTVHLIDIVMHFLICSSSLTIRILL